MPRDGPVGTTRTPSRPRPSACTAFRTDEWASAVVYTRPGGAPANPLMRASGRALSRAAASAEKVDMDAVSLIVPAKSCGSPMKARSQSSATSSSSVAAGELFHTIALTFSAAASSSPRMPGPDPEIAKYAKKAG